MQVLNITLSGVRTKAVSLDARIVIVFIFRAI